MNCVCPGCGKLLSEQFPHRHDPKTGILIIEQPYEIVLCAGCAKKLEDSIKGE